LSRTYFFAVCCSPLLYILQPRPLKTSPHLLKAFPWSMSAESFCFYPRGFMTLCTSVLTNSLPPLPRILWEIKPSSVKYFPSKFFPFESSSMRPSFFSFLLLSLLRPLVRGPARNTFDCYEDQVPSALFGFLRLPFFPYNGTEMSLQ